MPVAAARAPGQLSFALDNETATATLVECLFSCDLEMTFEHRVRTFKRIQVRCVPNLDRVERLPDASHWVHHDEAERVNQLLIDFFTPAE